MSNFDNLAGSTSFTLDPTPTQRQTASPDQNDTGMGRSPNVSSSPSSSPTPLPRPSLAFPGSPGVWDYTSTSVVFPEIVNRSMGSQTGIAGMETSELLSLWHYESSLRREAASVQMEVLNDNTDRRQHELNAMSLAFECEMVRFGLEHERLHNDLHQGNNEFTQAMTKINNERQQAENEYTLALKKLEIERLRLEILRDRKVSDHEELYGPVKKPRRPWYVRGANALAAERTVLKLVALVLLVNLIIRLGEGSQ